MVQAVPIGDDEDGSAGGAWKGDAAVRGKVVEGLGPEDATGGVVYLEVKAGFGAAERELDCGVGSAAKERNGEGLRGRNLFDANALAGLEDDAVDGGCGRGGRAGVAGEGVFELRIDSADNVAKDEAVEAGGQQLDLVGRVRDVKVAQKFSRDALEAGHAHGQHHFLQALVGIANDGRDGRYERHVLVVDKGSVDVVDCEIPPKKRLRLRSVAES